MPQLCQRTVGCLCVPPGPLSSEHHKQNRDHPSGVFADRGRGVWCWSGLCLQAAVALEVGLLCKDTWAHWSARGSVWTLSPGLWWPVQCGAALLVL